VKLSETREKSGRPERYKPSVDSRDSGGRGSSEECLEPSDLPKDGEKQTLCRSIYIPKRMRY
jgi:hypothetical protein